MEHGHVDAVVQSCKNIDMTMTTNNSFLSFWSTMKKHADILRSTICHAGDMYIFGHCNQTNDRTITV